MGGPAQLVPRGFGDRLAATPPTESLAGFPVGDVSRDVSPSRTRNRAQQERFPWPSPLTDRLGTLLAARRRVMLDDAYSGFTHVADRAIAPPRFAPDLSITHGGIATRDPGVSPDRTRTGRPS